MEDTIQTRSSDDYDSLWRMIIQLRRSESSFSQNDTVYGVPASLYGQAHGFPVSTNLPLQEQSVFPPVVARRNPRTSITCVAYVATLCSIVCFSMAFGVYNNRTITIGMGSSVLLQPNRFFVEKINVEQPFKKTVGPILYGFSKKPHLDHITSWSDAHSASLQSNSHKGWMYFLNEGSRINITYTAVGSSKLLITIRRGSDGYGHGYGDGYCYASDQCLDDESGPNTILSWNIIQGNGVIQQNILQSGNYYIAVENLNRDVEEVELNISGRALVYDTDEAYYMCNLARGRCVFNVLLLKENHVVLSTPQFTQETPNGEWQVKLSYEWRWITFYGGIVVMNGMIFIGVQLRKS